MSPTTNKNHVVHWHSFWNRLTLASIVWSQRQWVLAGQANVSISRNTVSHLLRVYSTRSRSDAVQDVFTAAGCSGTDRWHRLFVWQLSSWYWPVNRMRHLQAACRTRPLTFFWYVFLIYSLSTCPLNHGLSAGHPELNLTYFSSSAVRGFYSQNTAIMTDSKKGLLAGNPGNWIFHLKSYRILK